MRLIKKLIFWDLLKSFTVTLSSMIKGRRLINYPYEKTLVNSKFRGELALRRYADGEERCIACKLCETVCPAQAINIESVPRKDGARRTIIHDIDMSKCIYCGLCQEACPVEALVFTSNMEFAAETSDELIYNKDKLLKNGDVWEVAIANNINKEEVV